MTAHSKLALFTLIFSVSSIYADSYDNMLTAIRQSDYDRIKYIASLASFSDNEKLAFHSLANEIIVDRKAALENRKFNVRASLILKVTSPLTFFGGLVGYCIDPRGIAGLFAIPTSLGALFSLAAFAAPFAPQEQRLQLTSLSLFGTASAAAAYGLIKLEKYFWERARKIDQELQQAIAKATDCKTLLISLFGADSRSADVI